MAAFSVDKNFTILTLPDISIVLISNGDNYDEKLLNHVSSVTKEELDTTDGSIPISSSLSNNCQYFTCCIYKDLYLWKTDAWNLLSKRLLNRSASAVTFTPDNRSIVIADKSGDVFLFSVENAEKNGELILGHISMLLDVLITPDIKFIATCDRDEKIRISCFPNAYNIQSYCLGHEEFVTCVILLPHHEDTLVSAGGDGTIRFWDYKSGKQLLSQVCAEMNDQKAVVSRIASNKCSDNSSVLCVLIVALKGIQVYNVCSGNNNELSCSYKEVLSLESEPWCLTFANNVLWVLKPNIDECIVSYFYCKDSKEFSLDNTNGIKNSLRKYSENLEEVFKHDRQLSVFYKRRFDNVQEYLKKKMMRIENDPKTSSIDQLSSSEIT